MINLHNDLDEKELIKDIYVTTIGKTINNSYSKTLITLYSNLNYNVLHKLHDDDAFATSIVLEFIILDKFYNNKNNSNKPYYIIECQKTNHIYVYNNKLVKKNYETY